MLDRRHVADRRVFHVEIVLADEDDGQLPDRGEIQRLVEGADIGGAVAEEAGRDVVLALVLRAPGGAAGDRQMRADDGVGAHHAVLDRGEMHRAALAAHQAVVALHQLAQNFLDRHAAGERVGMAAIGAEAQIAVAHGGGKAGRHRLLAEREVAGALDQVLQKEIVGALLGFADHHLHAVELEPHLLADVVVQAGHAAAAGLFDMETSMAGLAYQAVLRCGNFDQPADQDVGWSRRRSRARARGAEDRARRRSRCRRPPRSNDWAGRQRPESPAQ